MGRSTLSGEAGTNQLSLRLAAMYFDLAIQPSNNVWAVKSSHPLGDRKFLKRTVLSVEGISNALVMGGPYAGQDLPTAMLNHTFKQIPSSNKGRWSLVGEQPNLNAHHNEFDTVYLSLLGQFPVPSDGASFDDILNFNKENRSSLLEFRNSVALLSHQILTAKNEPMIADLVRDTVQRRLDLIDQQLRRGPGSKILESFSIGIAVPNAAIVSLFAALGVPASAAMFVGNAITLGLGKSPIRSDKLAPDCHYVLDAHKAGLFEER